MDNTSGKKRLFLLNILLVLLAVSVIAVFYLSDSKNSNEKTNEDSNNEVIDIEENTESPTETTKVSVEGTLYDLDKIPVIQKGTKFRFFSSLEGVTKVELILNPGMITYSTPGDSTGKWEIEIDTDRLEKGNYSIELKFFRQGEMNSSSKETSTFSIGKSENQVKSDILTKIKPYSSYIITSIVAIILINLLVMAILMRKNKQISIDYKVSGTSEEVKLEPAKELDLHKEE